MNDMDLEQRLRQLNKIEPNQVYARSSRARILTARPRLTVRGFVLGLVQSGSAIALTGVLLFLAVGGFSLWRVLGPLTGLDPKALHAEAEAIDIQIHLADVQFKDGGAFDRQSLIAARPGAKPPAATVGSGNGNGSELPATTAAEAPTSTDSGAANATSTASSTTAITVDDVLQILSR